MKQEPTILSRRPEIPATRGGVAVLHIGAAGFCNMDNSVTELDWRVALNHLSLVKKHYQGLIGLPSANPSLALCMVFAPIEFRIASGERTQELFDAILALE